MTSLKSFSAMRAYDSVLTPYRTRSCRPPPTAPLDSMLLTPAILASLRSTLPTPVTTISSRLIAAASSAKSATVARPAVTVTCPFLSRVPDNDDLHGLLTDRNGWQGVVAGLVGQSADVGAHHGDCGIEEQLAGLGVRDPPFDAAGGPAWNRRRRRRPAVGPRSPCPGRAAPDHLDRARQGGDRVGGVEEVRCAGGRNGGHSFGARGRRGRVDAERCHCCAGAHERQQGCESSGSNESGSHSPSSGVAWTAAAPEWRPPRLQAIPIDTSQGGEGCGFGRFAAREAARSPENAPAPPTSTPPPPPATTPGPSSPPPTG